MNELTEKNNEVEERLGKGLSFQPGLGKIYCLENKKEMKLGKNRELLNGLENKWQLKAKRYIKIIQVLQTKGQKDQEKIEELEELVQELKTSSGQMKVHRLELEYEVKNLKIIKTELESLRVAQAKVIKELYDEVNKPKSLLSMCFLGNISVKLPNFKFVKSLSIDDSETELFCREESSFNQEQSFFSSIRSGVNTQCSTFRDYSKFSTVSLKKEIEGLQFSPLQLQKLQVSQIFSLIDTYNLNIFEYFSTIESNVNFLCEKLFKSVSKTLENLSQLKKPSKNTETIEFKLKINENKEKNEEVSDVNLKIDKNNSKEVDIQLKFLKENSKKDEFSPIINEEVSNNSKFSEYQRKIEEFSSKSQEFDRKFEEYEKNIQDFVDREAGYEDLIKDLEEKICLLLIEKRDLLTIISNERMKNNENSQKLKNCSCFGKQVEEPPALQRVESVELALKDLEAVKSLAETEKNYFLDHIIMIERENSSTITK
jgi:hypothetical protein